MHEAHIKENRSRTSSALDVTVPQNVSYANERLCTVPVSQNNNFPKPPTDINV